MLFINYIDLILLSNCYGVNYETTFDIRINLEVVYPLIDAPFRQNDF